MKRDQETKALLWKENNGEGKKVQKGWNFLLLFSLFLSSIIGSSLFYVWTRIQVIQYGYELSKALKEGKDLQETHKRLRLEVTMLKSFDRIEKIATEELGMVKPRSEQVIIIR